MKLYLATKFELATLAAQTALTLEKQGHVITHKWWEYEGQLAGVEPGPYWEVAAIRDIQAVRDADAVVVLFPDERNYRGTYCEIGAALALGKPIYVIGEYAPPTVFMYHPSVKRGIPPVERKVAWQKTTLNSRFTPEA